MQEVIFPERATHSRVTPCLSHPHHTRYHRACFQAFSIFQTDHDKPVSHSLKRGFGWYLGSVRRDDTDTSNNSATVK